MEITYRARSYHIERLEQETDENLAQRSWFIIKLLDPSQSVLDRNNSESGDFGVISFDEAVLLSKYWYYIHKYDCRYSAEIMTKIANAEKLLYV
jgi:hypothetical protein